jgi:hypothetical protein
MKMAREKKEKPPIIEVPVYSGEMEAQAAVDMARQKEEKIKLGLIIAAAVQLSWLVGIAISGASGTIAEIFATILLIGAMVGTVAAYVIGGGVKIAFRAAWAVSRRIAWFGWFVAPFPTDIILGLSLSMMGIALFPLMLIMLPVVFVGISYKQNRTNRIIAEQYLASARRAAAAQAV